MVDETTDISNKEQAVICFHWVDGQLEAHEEFVALENINSTEATSILAAIKKVLETTNISISRLRGQCYDGASSMSGTKQGVAAMILKEELT